MNEGVSQIPAHGAAAAHGLDVATGAVAGMAVGCLAAVISAHFISESDLSDRAAEYGRRAARYTRPYVRRARKVANNYWPF